MKKTFLFMLIFVSEVTFAQITSFTPNHSRRGIVLTTTITPYGSSMAISSGHGSMYQFWLQKGTEVINGWLNNYTSSGTGWATAAHVTFNIPLTATPGQYDLHVNDNSPGTSWWGHQIASNAFQIYETTISGQVFFDANQNGILDSSENGLYNQIVHVNPGSVTVRTGMDGFYYGLSDSGTLTSSPVMPPGFTITSPASYTVTVPPSSYGNNFGLYTPPSAALLHSFNASTFRIRCMRPSNAVWSVTSLSNNVQAGTITMILDSSVSFINSDIAPVYTSVDTLRWNYILQPFQSISNNVTLLGGQPGSYNILVYDSLFDSGGTFVNNFAQALKGSIACSYDPNDISVSGFLSDSIYPSFYLNDTLIYTIRFQNCGTDTAFDITVLNWIHQNLDLNSLQILYASAPFSIQYENNRTLRFKFENIQLPDSNIDELNSHGMIVYRIQPVSSAPNNSTITNDAYIYFDYNPAVVTNTLRNTLISPNVLTEVSTIRSNDYLLSPVPVHDFSILKLPDMQTYKLMIFDIAGRQLINESISSSYILNAYLFAEGIFFYQLVSNSKILFTGRFCVVH